MESVVVAHDDGSDLAGLTSRAVERVEAEYCMVRPRSYREVETRFREWFDHVDAPWDCFWFRFEDPVIFTAPRRDEGFQERNGALAQVNNLVRQGFERLTGQSATNFVLYADEVTIWCDFFAEGFWATRFADDKTGYRGLAAEAAEKGWQIATEVLRD